MFSEQNFFYLVVHDVNYGSVMPVQMSVVNSKFDSLEEAEEALEYARVTTPEAYLVKHSRSS